VNLIRHPFAVLLWLAFAHLAAASLSPEQVQLLPAPAARRVQFVRDIKPILDASCVQCHGRGRSKGGLQLDTRETLLKGGDSGPALVIGNSQESLLIALVSGSDPENVMPKKGSRLTADQVGLLRAWIDQGLYWDSGITFARPAPLNLNPRKPNVQVSAESGVNPIDQILKPYFEQKQFKPVRIVDDHTFARRAYLDTIGLLPPADGPGAFVTDGDPELRVRLVRQLLADNQHYAEHWLSFWNDLLRNDYRGTGYIDGGRKSITPWLYQALLTNMPYDKFVAQLVSPVPGSEGFTKGIVWRGVVNASQTPALQAAQNISQVFMGVNLKCASCHDSFINDWKLSDAYNLAAVYSDEPLELFRCDKPTGKWAQARFIYPQLGEMDPRADKPTRRKRLAEIITGPNDGRLPRTIVNRLWARFFGRGLVEPVDDMEQPAWNPDLLDWLAEDLVAHNYDLKQTIEVMLTSHAYQMPATTREEDLPKQFVFRGPEVRRLSAEEFRDALGEVTGVWFDHAEFSAPTREIRACRVTADPLAVALGRPNREQVITCRADGATTLQALELTNGQTLATILERCGRRLAEFPLSPGELIAGLYTRAFGRNPSVRELQMAANLLGESLEPEGVEDLLWALTMTPEFQLIY
jgi:mono/diheme cytochrome c family protein